MSFADAAARYYETRSHRDADVFVDQLEQQLQDALLDEHDSEQHIDAVLDALQDVLVEDLPQTSEAPSIEASTSSLTLDGGGSYETLIQATSLTLLPVLLRFPNISAETSETLLRLCLLVAQRANPKEVWMALETSLEKVESSSDRFDQDEDSDDVLAIDTLVKALLTAKIVLPRIKARRPSTFFFPFFSALYTLLDKLQDTLAQEPEESFPASLLLSSILDLVDAVSKISKVTSLQEDKNFLLVLHGCIALAFSLCSPALEEGPPLSIAAKVPRGGLDTALPDHARNNAGYTSGWNDLLTTLAGIASDTAYILRNALDTQSDDSSLKNSDSHILNAVIILAHERRLERQPDFSFVLRHFADLLERIWSTRNQALAGRALDALTYLCQKVMEDAFTSDNAGSATSDEPDSEAVVRTIESITQCLDRVPPALMPGAISLIELTVLQYACRNSRLQDRLLDTICLEDASLPCKNTGIRLIRALLLRALQADQAKHRFPAFFERFGRGIFKYDRTFSSSDKFWDGPVQSLLISQLNLLYLILQNDGADRSLDIWQEEHLGEITEQLLEPIKEDLKKFSNGDDADFEVVMARDILGEALDRVGKAWPTRS